MEPNQTGKLLRSEGNHEKQTKRQLTVVPVMAQWLTNLTGNHEVAGLIPGLTQWVKDQLCCQLKHRLQRQLQPGVAVALV